MKYIQNILVVDEWAISFKACKRQVIGKKTALSIIQCVKNSSVYVPLTLRSIE